MSTHPNQIGTDPIAAAGKAKTVCTIARQSRPPEFVASLRDADTETCRTSSGMSAAASGIRYAGEGWARVPIRLPLPRPEWNVKSGAAICALMKTLAGIGRVYRDGRRRAGVSSVPVSPPRNIPTRRRDANNQRGCDARFAPCRGRHDRNAHTARRPAHGQEHGRALSRSRH
jgi:hypothetical protein